MEIQHTRFVEPFKKEDFVTVQGDMILKREAVFERLNKVFTPQGWSITYTSLGESIGCTIKINGIEKTGCGSDALVALTDAMYVWGVPTEVDQEVAQVLPPPPPPKDPTAESRQEGGLKPPPLDDMEPQPSEKVWTDERSEKMRTIKTKLKIRDNGEFGPHIEMWSKGRLDSIVSLTPKDADEFIKYMMDKYINRIGTGAQPSAGTNEDEE